MALPASGNQITFNQINVELGNTGTDQISLNDAAVRALFGESSGAISMSDGFGASSFTPWYGTRGIFGGGYGYSNHEYGPIHYITIASTGNSSSFGVIGNGASSHAKCTGLSNGTRGIFAGGQTYPGPSTLNLITYITVASTGNGTDFGNLTLARYELTGASNDVRGIIAGGKNSSDATVNRIDYITIASTGNAIDFGNLGQTKDRLGSVSNASRVIFGGGSQGSSPHMVNVMEYITIASTGNTTDFGDLIEAIRAICGTESSTRGIFYGGYPGGTDSDTIQYITTASTGNATDFGNISQVFENPHYPRFDDEEFTTGVSYSAGCSNGTRAVFGGGNPYSTQMNYITIASTGNTADFGDLDDRNYHMGAFSGS